MYCKVTELTVDKAVEVIRGLLALTGNAKEYPDLNPDYFIQNRKEIEEFLMENNILDFNTNEQLGMLVRGYISHKYAEETTHSDKVYTYFTQHMDNNYVQIHEDTQSILITGEKFELIYFAWYNAYVLRKGTISDCAEAFKKYAHAGCKFFNIPVTLSKQYLNNRFREEVALEVQHNKYTALMSYNRDDDFILSTIPVPSKELSV